MKMIILLLLPFCFTPCLAEEAFAKIIFLKGSASFQKNDEKNRQILKLGDELKNKTTLYTAEKSLLKIQLSDGSILTLNPHSTLYLDKLETTKPSLLQLLSGKLRAQVKKHTQNDYGLFIKTSTASLGVRGTDFEIIYNPINRISSALTFSGEVAFVSAKGIEHFDNPNSKEEYDEAYQNVLKEDLETEKTKHLHAGEFSGSYPGHTEALVPVKISLQQFEALKKAKSPSYDEVKHVQAAPEKGPTNDVLIPRPRAEYTKENYPTDVLAMPGGYLDQETGIYISPPKDALYDEKEKIYVVPKEYGNVDAETGDYIPPLGFILHPLKGFIFLEDQFSKLTEGTKTLIKKLNSSLKKGMVDLKELTRLDASLLPSLYYDSNVTSDFYDRLMTVTKKASPVLRFEGFLAHKTFDSKNWLIYPKGSVTTRYHYNQEEMSINTQDSIDWTAGLEINHRYLISHRPGRQILDFGYHIQMKDQKGSDKYAYETEDLFVIFGEEFKLHRKQTTKIYGKFRYYETYLDKIGTIWSAHLLHSIDMGRKHDFKMGSSLMRERPHNEKTIFLWDGFLSHTRKNLWDEYSFVSSFKMKYTDFHLLYPERNTEFLISPEFRLIRSLDDYINLSVFINYERNYSSQKDPFDYSRTQTGIDMNFVF